MSNSVYIVLYKHRHGNDAWPRFVAEGAPAPSLSDEADQLEDFEPDDGEYLEVFGPFPVMHSKEHRMTTSTQPTTTTGPLLTVYENRTLTELLDDVSVHAPGMWDNETGPQGWFAVSDCDGIKAYFADEHAAYRWRLSEINRIMNG